jgi:hypothetical protein
MKRETDAMNEAYLGLWYSICLRDGQAAQAASLISSKFTDDIDELFPGASARRLQLGLKLAHFDITSNFDIDIPPNALPS